MTGWGKCWYKEYELTDEAKNNRRNLIRDYEAKIKEIKEAKEKKKKRKQKSASMIIGPSTLMKKLLSKRKKRLYRIKSPHCEMRSAAFPEIQKRKIFRSVSML